MHNPEVPDLLDAAVRANARLQAGDLGRQLATDTGPFAALLQSGELKIVTARYDLDTGAVTVLP